VLAGHSLGAAEAVRYLAAHPDGRIAALVLSAPNAPALRRGPGNPGGTRVVNQTVLPCGACDGRREGLSFIDNNDKR
jgi:pimeloyl-ACP methyl ester carboxylesterase